MAEPSYLMPATNAMLRALPVGAVTVHVSPTLCAAAGVQNGLVIIGGVFL